MTYNQFICWLCDDQRIYKMHGATIKISRDCVSEQHLNVSVHNRTGLCLLCGTSWSFNYNTGQSKSLKLWRVGFDRMSVHVGPVVDRMTVGQVCIRGLRSFPACASNLCRSRKLFSSPKRPDSTPVSVPTMLSRLQMERS